MQKSTDRVRLDYYAIFKKNWNNHLKEPNFENPFFDLPNLLNYVISIPEKERVYSHGNRFVFLKTFKKSSDDKDIWTGVFISANINFAPNIINKVTLEEKKSNKTLEDGDKQKTHFAIKITNDNVFIISEFNRNGVSKKTFLSYLKSFTKKYSNVEKQNKRYSLYLDSILIDDFLKELRNIDRAKEIITYVDKKILGSDYLNFADKTSTIQNSIQIRMASEPGADIKSAAIDLFNLIPGAKKNKESPISRLRVIGNDSSRNEIRIDTTYIEKKEFIDVDLNSTTGEVNTTNILSNLKGLARLI